MAADSGGYRADNDGTIKFTLEEHNMLQSAQQIKHTFITCPVQKIAYDALVSDVLNCDFAWTTTIGTKSWRMKVSVGWTGRAGDVYDANQSSMGGGFV